MRSWARADASGPARRRPNSGGLAEGSCYEAPSEPLDSGSVSTAHTRTRVLASSSAHRVAESRTSLCHDCTREHRGGGTGGQHMRALSRHQHGSRGREDAGARTSTLSDSRSHAAHAARTGNVGRRCRAGKRRGWAHEARPCTAASGPSSRAAPGCRGTGGSCFWSREWR